MNKAQKSYAPRKGSPALSVAHPALLTTSHFGRQDTGKGNHLTG